MAADVEIPLEGGRITAGVVRVGDTVRRPAGPWTPAVQAFLLHLERQGFDGAPRALGTDEQGREVLSYVPGVTVWPHAIELLDDERNIARVGRLVRDLHDASVSFVPPAGCPLAHYASDPGGGSLVVHNDLGPWNLVVDTERDSWSIIDWDGIGLARPEWDLAYVLHTIAPTWPEDGVSHAGIASRLLTFAGGYRMDEALLAASLRLIPARCRAVAELIERQAAAGHPAFELMLADGDAGHWRAAAERIEPDLPVWFELCGLSQIS